MSTPELVGYISTQLRAGASKDTISATLSANGWADADIASGLEAADSQSGSAAAPITPQPTLQDRTLRLVPDIPGFNEQINDPGASTINYLVKRHPYGYYGTIGASVVAALFIGYLVILNYGSISQALGTNSQGNSNASITFFLPLLPFLVPVVLYWRRRIQMQRIFMQQLAAAIGFSYAPTGDAKSVSGRIFTFGHMPQMSDVFTGSYDGRPARIFRWFFTVGYGKGSHEEAWTIFEITLDRPLPEILLQPLKGTDGAAVGLFASWKPAGDEPIMLEGNFNTYFKVYAPQGFDMEIREILEPAFMADLIDRYQSVGFEMSQNRLSIYMFHVLKTRDDFLSFHELVDTLYNRILPSLREVETT